MAGWLSPAFGNGPRGPFVGESVAQEVGLGTPGVRVFDCIEPNLTRRARWTRPAHRAHSRREVFAQPGFTAVYAVGVVWSLCRWAIGFLGAYVVADTTESARLVQLTGALLWAPLLLTGVVGGAVSDRISRRHLLFVQFSVLGPLTAGIGWLALTDNLPLWLSVSLHGARWFRLGHRYDGAPNHDP